MNNNPARLWKDSQNNVDNHNSIEDKIEAFALRHASLILLLLFFTLGMLFVLVCYALVGVSAVDSGVQYNHMEHII